MNMEKITVDKNRLCYLITFAPIVVSLNNNIYGRCGIDCYKCKFFHKGCYYSKIANDIELEQLYRQEVILNWLKGE